MFCMLKLVHFLSLISLLSGQIPTIFRTLIFFLWKKEEVGWTRDLLRSYRTDRLFNRTQCQLSLFIKSIMEWSYTKGHKGLQVCVRTWEAKRKKTMSHWVHSWLEQATSSLLNCHHPLFPFCEKELEVIGRTTECQTWRNLGKGDWIENIWLMTPEKYIKNLYIGTYYLEEFRQCFKAFWSPLCLSTTWE